MTGISEYFRLVSVNDNVIHIELKGFWSDDVMDQFSEEILGTVTRAYESLRGKRPILLADWTESPIFGSKAEEHLAESVKVFKQYNGYKVIEVVPKTLVKMGLRKVAAQTGEEDFRIAVNTLAEAWDVIEELQKDL